MRAAFCSAGVLLQKKEKERKKLPAKIRNGFGKVGYTHLVELVPVERAPEQPLSCARLFVCTLSFSSACLCVWSYLWFTPHHACPVLACDYPCCWLRFGLCWVSGRLQPSFPLPRVPPLLLPQMLSADVHHAAGVCFGSVPPTLGYLTTSLFSSSVARDHRKDVFRNKLFYVNLPLWVIRSCLWHLSSLCLLSLLNKNAQSDCGLWLFVFSNEY